MSTQKAEIQPRQSAEAKKYVLYQISLILLSEYPELWCYSE